MMVVHYHNVVKAVNNSYHSYIVTSTFYLLLLEHYEKKAFAFTCCFHVASILDRHCNFLPLVCVAFKHAYAYLHNALCLFQSVPWEEKNEFQCQ